MEVFFGELIKYLSFQTNTSLSFIMKRVISKRIKHHNIQTAKFTSIMTWNFSGLNSFSLKHS